MSLLKIMKILGDYRTTYGKKINKAKSHYMTPSCVFHFNVKRIHQIICFTRKESPITYLGYSLYIGRKRIMHFNDLISKVVSRIRGWHGRMLSYGGKAILIKHVLQYLPIHLLSEVSLPKIVISKLREWLLTIFWGMNRDRNKYHWASWEKMSYPPEEEGSGFRTIADVCKAMESKWHLYQIISPCHHEAFCNQHHSPHAYNSIRNLTIITVHQYHNTHTFHHNTCPTTKIHLNLTHHCLTSYHLNSNLLTINIYLASQYHNPNLTHSIYQHSNIHP